MLDNYDVKSDTTDEEINEWDMCYDETKAVMEKSEKFIKEGIIDGVGGRWIRHCRQKYIIE